MFYLLWLTLFLLGVVSVARQLNLWISCLLRRPKLGGGGGGGGVEPEIR